MLSCSENTFIGDGIEPVNYGTEVSIGKNGLAKFGTENETVISVKVLTIVESRCPQDVTCVTAGEVKVDFQFGMLKSIINLCLGADASCQNVTVIPYPESESESEASYELKLIDVKPYPNTGNPNPELTVVFKVTKL